MQIRLKTVCPEQIGALPDGEYTVPDGCTAAEALRACMAAAGLEPLPPERTAQLIYMCQSRHIQPDTPLSEGDRLMILRPLTGG